MDQNARRRGGALLAIVMAAGVLALPGVAEAQFSKSYKFLEAVRKKDGQEVTDDLSEPGSTLINTRDVTSGESALHIVTARRDAAWVGFLLSKGADPNLRDNRGQTPLIVACNLGFIDGMQQLLDHGAQVDIRSSTGETPLIAAVHRHDVGMMRVLLKAGANPDTTDNTGRSARDYAAQDGDDSPMVAEIKASAKPATSRSSSAKYGPRL